MQALVMSGGQLQGSFSILPPSHRLQMHKLCRHVCGNKQPFLKPSLLVREFSLDEYLESSEDVTGCRVTLPEHQYWPMS